MLHALFHLPLGVEHPAAPSIGTLLSVNANKVALGTQMACTDALQSEEIFEKSNDDGETDLFFCAPTSV